MITVTFRLILQDQLSENVQRQMSSSRVSGSDGCHSAVKDSFSTRDDTARAMERS